MLKVFIVDDEIIQREGLIKYVPWENYNMEIIGNASDGIEALEVISKLLPDILITDVKMPRMNGLELSRKAKEIFPDIKILIISGYKDFESARAAIEMNAYAFIIKPVIMEKFEQELVKIQLKFQKEKVFNEEYARIQKQLEESKPLLMERFIKDLLYGFLIDEETIRRRAEYLSMELLKRKYHLLLIQVDKKNNFSTTEDNILLFYLNLSSHLISVYGNSSSDILIQIKEDEYVLITFDTSLDEIQLHDLIREIRQSVHSLFDRTVTIGISNAKSNIVQLREAYIEAEMATKQKFYLGKGKNIFFRDINITNNIPIVVEERYEKLISDVEVGNVDVVEETTNMVFLQLSRASGIEEHYVRAFCYRIIGDIYRILYNKNEKAESIFGEEYILWNKICRYDTIPDVWQWLKNIINAVTRHIYNKHTKKNITAVDTIIEILETKFYKHITIEELSRQVFLAPNYISNIFKEKTGESVIDYLTKVRMKHARELLSNQSLRIFEVAEKVGFDNTSYFSAVFKNSFGLTPKKFRESIFNHVNEGEIILEKDISQDHK